MKLQPLFCLLCLLGVGIASAEPIKFVIKNKGEKVGTLVQETTGDDDSGYVDDTTWTMTQDSKSVKIHEISHYGKDGVDSSKTVEFTVDGHEAKAKAVLSDDGAKVTLWSDDQKDEKEIPLASKASRKDETNFWFKKTKPEVNATVTYQSFDMQDLTWSDVTLKYIGRKTIKVNGKDVEANEISRTQGEDTSSVFVDDHGDALLVTQGDLTIERDDTV